MCEWSGVGMSAGQELFGNEHEHEPSQEGNRDGRCREARALRRNPRFAGSYDGFYASGILALGTYRLRSGLMKTNSGMMIPNPAPRSSPDPKAVSLDIDDPTASQHGYTYRFAWILLARKREEQR